MCLPSSGLSPLLELQQPQGSSHFGCLCPQGASPAVKNSWSAVVLRPATPRHAPGAGASGFMAPLPCQGDTDWDLKATGAAEPSTHMLCPDSHRFYHRPGPVVESSGSRREAFKGKSEGCMDSSLECVSYPRLHRYDPPFCVPSAALCSCRLQSSHHVQLAAPGLLRSYPREPRSGLGPGQFSQRAVLATPSFQFSGSALLPPLFP